MIELTVDTITESSFKDLFQILLDFENYANWWKPTPWVDVVNQSFVFYPLPLVRIKLQYRSHEWGKELCYSYQEGPFRGEGIWWLAKADGDEPFKLMYTVKLEGKNRLFDRIIQTKLFKLQHERDVKRLGKNLKHELWRLRLEKN